MTENKSLPWDIVEKAIYKEIKWLRDSIETSPFIKDELSPFGCNNCIYREIAILIVSGKIKVREIKSPNMWGYNKIIPGKNITKPHGKDWHNNKMKIISNYFKKQGYTVENEPKLNYESADLLVYKKGERDIYVEVGTVSLYKILYNLKTMNFIDILIVPQNNYLIEFRINKNDYI